MTIFLRRNGRVRNRTRKMQIAGVIRECGIFLDIPLPLLLPRHDTNKLIARNPGANNNRLYGRY